MALQFLAAAQAMIAQAAAATPIAPQPNLGLGADTSCTDSILTGQLSYGVRLVAESYYRRLTTPRGTLIGGEDEADFGLDLQGSIGTVTTTQDAAALGGKIQSELMKDQRSYSIAVSVTETTTSAGLSSFVVAIDAQTSAGPFTLTIGVSSVTVELLGVTGSVTTAAPGNFAGLIGNL